MKNRHLDLGDHFVCDKTSMSVAFATCHQYLKLVTNTLDLQHPSTTSTEKSIKINFKTVEREKLILSWDANAPTKAQLTNLIKSKTSIFEKSRSDKEFNPYFQMAKTQECF